MNAVVKAFLAEPVVFLGVVQAVATALAAEAVVAGWIGVVVVAACVPFQRHLVEPKRG